ncbi:hypothetical protein AQ729_18185 [Burkholderia pseudomallei]|nr:hypothetical protein AQ841_18140 [Burkholderia pseudomallei]OMR66678.1 hypothetical protein AQ729_18185 [Burkholderia pseudomallei]ONE75744.1 hypothetical protein AQ956_24105 [Burkholderia pseudomallei]
MRGALVLQSVRMGAARRTEGGIAPFERRETDMSGGEQGVGAIASSDRFAEASFAEKKICRHDAQASIRRHARRSTSKAAWLPASATRRGERSPRRETGGRRSSA